MCLAQNQNNSNFNIIFWAKNATIWANNVMIWAKNVKMHVNNVTKLTSTQTFQFQLVSQLVSLPCSNKQINGSIKITNSILTKPTLTNSTLTKPTLTNSTLTNLTPTNSTPTNSTRTN